MRNIDSNLAAALGSGTIRPFFMATLQFKTSIQRVWTGTGELTIDSQTFVGVGSLASVGAVTEGTDVAAYGTSVTLSGIDPVLLGESMNDIQPGLQALMWLGLMDGNGIVIGTPYQVFRGIIDEPNIHVGEDTMTITLNLESRMVDFQRASNRRYTSADQRARFPHDSGFDFVEKLNDFVGKWQ
jgi:hypothetical protein